MSLDINDKEARLMVELLEQEKENITKQHYETVDRCEAITQRCSDENYTIKRTIGFAVDESSKYALKRLMIMKMIKKLELEADLYLIIHKEC